MTFKEKVVKLRKLKGLTQDEFASAVGVSRQAVYKWESGQSYPEVAKLLEMKILFNISIDDLLDDSYEVVVPEKKKKRIPKSVKAEIEKAVEVEAAVPAPAEAEEAVVQNEPAAEEAPVLEAAPVAEEAPVPQEISGSEADVEEPKKKVGFFGRLFGKK